MNSPYGNVQLIKTDPTHLKSEQLIFEYKVDNMLSFYWMTIDVSPLNNIRILMDVYFQKNKNKIKDIDGLQNAHISF